jgi:methylenetetrahydrofolate dehydrogenase (NADP+)/methenyltetrahydrofolate cyclohydrolase
MTIDPGSLMAGPHQAIIMDGAALAQKLLPAVARRAASFRARAGRSPCLAAVLVGDNPSSLTYVRMKERRCASVGIDSRVVRMPADASTSEVVDGIGALCGDREVDGILLQHPVPRGIDERAAFEAIGPDKDVDGVTMHSFASMAFGLPGFSSCTPLGIMHLLDEYGVDPSGRHAVVVGRSPILGKPIGMLLLARDATVTFCHSRTRHLESTVGSADIVVAAVGQPSLIRGDWLKPGAVVVDAGYANGSTGDVGYAEASAVASLITPVPGGVGPMTIAMLVEQTMTAAERSEAGGGPSGSPPGPATGDATTSSGPP